MAGGPVAPIVGGVVLGLPGQVSGSGYTVGTGLRSEPTYAWILVAWLCTPAEGLVVHAKRSRAVAAALAQDTNEERRVGVRWERARRVRRYSHTRK